MTSGFQADTAQLALTSQNAAASAQAILQQFTRMQSDTGTALGACKGAMFLAAADALTELQNQRNKLLPKLQELSQELSQSAQGFDGQDLTGATSIRNRVGVLNAPINLH